MSCPSGTGRANAGGEQCGGEEGTESQGGVEGGMACQGGGEGRNDSQDGDKNWVMLKN